MYSLRFTHAYRKNEQLELWVAREKYVNLLLGNFFECQSDISGEVTFRWERWTNNINEGKQVLVAFEAQSFLEFAQGTAVLRLF